MQLDKIEDVLSENLGEGYRIVRDNCGETGYLRNAG